MFFKFILIYFFTLYFVSERFFYRGGSWTVFCVI